MTPMLELDQDRRRRLVSALDSTTARLLGLLVFVLLVRALSFRSVILNSDEEIFMIAAREVLNGYLPYVRFFDVKPVGSPFIFALAFGMFGLRIITARLLGALFVWLGAVLLASLSRAGGQGRFGSFCVGLLYAAYSMLMGGMSTITETLLIPFTIIAILLNFRLLASATPRAKLGISAAAGLACGLAVLIKIVPIVPGGAVALLVCAILVRRRLASATFAFFMLATFTAAAVLPMSVAGLVYAKAGEFSEFWYANFGFAHAYQATHPSLRVISVRLAGVVEALWPLLILAAIGVAAQARAWRRKQPVDDLALLAGIWLAGELAACAATLQFYTYYFLTIVPPVALLAMFGIAALAKWIAGEPRRSRAAAVLVCAALLVGVEQSEVETLRYMVVHKDPSRAIALAIKRADPDRIPTMFVTSYDRQLLYVLTGASLPPTRFALPSHLLSAQSKVIGVDPLREVARILDSRPEYLVFDQQDNLPAWALALFSSVPAHYRLFWSHGTVRVYRLI